MATITEAKSLRFTIALNEDTLHIKENASAIGNIQNAFKKMNIFDGKKKLLLNLSYPLEDIKEAKFVDVTIDVSQLVLVLKDGETKTFDLTSTDPKKSHALKTNVEQIAYYIQSKK